MVDAPVHRVFRFARKAQKRLAGVPITLRRRNATSDGWLLGNATAVIGETRTTDFLNDGLAVTVRYCDYMIDVTEYVIGGNEVTPEMDDQILIEVDGVTRRYQVLPSPGEGEYERSDRLGTVWRVHTREITDE